MVIFDEIHLLRDTAKVFRTIFDTVIEDHKKVILGLTATLDEKDLSKYHTILTLLPPVKRYPIRKAIKFLFKVIVMNQFSKLIGFRDNHIHVMRS